MIARCAGEDRYFGVVDLLFRDQANWAHAADAQGVVGGLYAIGRQAGLTDAEMDACLKDGDFAEALVAEFQKNAAADGVEATPSFVLNGEKVVQRALARVRGEDRGEAGQLTPSRKARPRALGLGRTSFPG